MRMSSTNIASNSKRADDTSSGSDTIVVTLTVIHKENDTQLEYENKYDRNVV